MAGLSEIQYFTNEMLVCARQGEWELLTDLERHRGEKIRTFFEGRENRKPTEQLLQWYEDLKQKDAEIKQLCETHKKALMKQMGQFRRGKQISAAYTAA